MNARKTLLGLGLTLLAGSAAAHVGDHANASFFSGFGHPLGGMDHLLAMLAVGLFAVRQSGVARYALPASFVLAMLAGAGLSALGIALPAVESGIAVSVLVLGLLIAFLARLPIQLSLPLVAAFALFHGYAHHVEIGEASLLTYVAGFALATALLHVAGFLIGRWMPETQLGQRVQRVMGAGIAAAGALFIGA